MPGLLLCFLLLAACSSPVAETQAAPEVIPNVVYCSPDGNDLRMDVYQPSTPGIHHAVIHLHTGRWNSGKKSTGPGVEDIAALLESGFAVFSINYRLSPGARFPAQINDAKCAVRHIRANAAQYEIDPEWIGVYGFGGGGHLAALLGVTAARDGFEGNGGFEEQSSRVQAVVAVGGIFDVPNYMQIAPAKEMKEIFGVDKNNAGYTMLGQYSPTRYVSGNSAPFLLIHGDSDAIVPLIQSQVMHQNLLGAGIESTLLVVENADHGLGAPGEPIVPSRVEITAAIVDFFRVHAGIQIEPTDIHE